MAHAGNEHRQTCEGWGLGEFERESTPFRRVEELQVGLAPRKIAAGLATQHEAADGGCPHVAADMLALLAA